MKLRAAIAAALLGFAPAGTGAEPGPPVGAEIPRDFSARDQYDRLQDFRSLARRRGLVIMFTRSLDW